MNRELQYDREVELQQQENFIENKNELLNKMEFLLKEKYRNSPLILKVYIDREKDKYYIDTFAAYSLGFISYQKAASDSDSGRKLFEISKATLEMLERVFKGRILYQYL